MCGCLSRALYWGLSPVGTADIIEFWSLSVEEGHPGHCGGLSSIPGPTHLVPGAPPK